MTERLNDHNVSLNTQSAPGACAQIHLPSGQICELPIIIAGAGSCLRPAPPLLPTGAGC
jgi:hypothetical protein